jgi:hypothetical protein
MVKKLEEVTTELKEQSVPPEVKVVDLPALGEEVELWSMGWQKTKVNGVNTALNECSTEMGPYLRRDGENKYWRRVMAKVTFRYQGEPKPNYVYVDGCDHGDVSPHGITSKDIQIANLNAEIAKLKDQLETERMRLAACGVAALSNTRVTAMNQGLRRDNPYWSASYEDVRTAVKREMNHRESCEELSKAFERLTKDYDAQKKKISTLEGISEKYKSLHQALAKVKEKLTMPMLYGDAQVIEILASIAQKDCLCGELTTEEKKAFQRQVIPVIAKAVEAFARDYRCHGNNVWANKIENTVSGILRNVVEELKV